MNTLNIITGEIEKRDFADMFHVYADETGEKGDTKSITETGYIPPTQQIKDMMQAGIRLAKERRARFDSLELNLAEDEEPPFDPTREPNVDLVDVQRAHHRAQANMKEAAKRAQKALEKAKTPSPTVPPEGEKK